MKLRVWGFVAGTVLVSALWLGRWVGDYYDLNSIAHQSMRGQLEFFSASVYEYRDKTGRWPTRFEDMGQTSLPQKSPYWKDITDAIVIFWPTTFSPSMDPDPKNNGQVVLGYYKGGLFSQFGRVWVCWGDLRTEFVPISVVKK